MPDPNAPNQRQTNRKLRRRQRRRRRIAVVAGAAVIVAAAAGTARAVSGSSGPGYRLARVTEADIAQTVDADGTLTSQHVATQSFDAAGTVRAVRVRTGEHVTAGETLATLDPASLKADVTSARNTLAGARQTLADDEAGETSTSTGSGTTSNSTTTSQPSSTSNATTTSSTKTDATITTRHSSNQQAVLVSDVSPAPTAGGSSGELAKAQAAVRAAQKAVVTAQSAVDDDVAQLSSACTTSGDTETTSTVVATSSGSVTGKVDTAAVVTIADSSTTSDNPQTVAAGGSWTFDGLSAGQSYRIVSVPVVDNSACSAAITKVSDDEGSKGSTSSSTLTGALTQLTSALTSFEKAADAAAKSSGTTSGTGATGTGTRGTGGTGTKNTGTKNTGTKGTGTTKSTGTSSGSGSTSGATSASTTSSTASAALIAADQKSIDAAKASLAVARNDVGLATLTTPISGTVASVGITVGSDVSASSSSDTIVVTGDQALSVPVDVSLADIDLIKVGESASVVVDGHTTPLTAKVSMIGVANASSSTGSSSEYEVTLVLARRYATLFDGMGASASIDVGSAEHALSVPLSAVHTSATRSTVEVYSAGKVVATPVTLGVEGTSRVQIRSGLKTGQQVVLADLGEALPSSDSTSSTSRSGGLSGSFGSSSGGFGGGPGGSAGGPP